MPTPLSVRNTNLPRNQFQNFKKLSVWAWTLPILPLCIWLSASMFTTPETLFRLMNQQAQALPNSLWVVFDLFGNGWFDFALATPLLLLAPRNLIASLIAGALAGSVGRIIKITLELPRPAGVLDPASFHILGRPLTAFSMPSGHTLTAFSLISAIYFSTPQEKRKALRLLFILAIGTGLARVAVGAHWPADIFAGASIGMLGGLAGAYLSDKIPERTLRPQSWLLRILAAGSCLCVYVLVTSEIDFIEAIPFQWAVALFCVLSLIFFILQTVRRPTYH